MPGTTKAVRVALAVAVSWGASACASGPSRLQQEIAAAEAAGALTNQDSARVGGVPQPVPAAGAVVAPAVSPAPAQAMAAPANPSAAGPAPAAMRGVTRAMTVERLAAPSGVALDTAANLVYVAGGEGKDAYVVRIDSTGRLLEERWLKGSVAAAAGKPPTTAAARRAAAARANAMRANALEAPRGLAIVGDTLWVADVKTLRGFSRTTGAPIGTINLAPAGATLLADVAVGPDGSLYVTDAAVTYSARGIPQRTGRDAIFRITGRTSQVAIETPRLANPMGLAWDRSRDRFLVASSGSDTIFSWRPGSSTLEVAGHGTGQWEGVVATTTGGYLATSRASQSIFRFENSTYGTRLLELTRAGGDLALDSRRGRLVVALPSEGKVEVWQAPR